MNKNKYTPPPKYKGPNSDRGFYIEQKKPEQKPISNMFPVTKKPKDLQNNYSPFKDD